jgi:hypothetical protein
MATAFCYAGAMLDDAPGTAARLDALEHWRAGDARQLGDRKRPRDGRRALSVRAGEERIARVHEAARRRGCTLTEILNEAIDYVIRPSAQALSEPHASPPAFTPHKLPREATRQALSTSLAEQARLAAAGAATMAGRQPPDGRMTEPGMMTELPGSLRARRR